MKKSSCEIKRKLIVPAFLIYSIIFFLMPYYSSAQSVNASGIISGGTVLGGHMLTAYMVNHNLFLPHANNCGDDAWVPLFSGAESGFCIEKDERSSLIWVDAVRTCLQEHKRLPEPAEWQLACYQSGTLGLSNMTNNYEWTSNFTRGYNFEKDQTPVKVAVPIMGDGSCKKSSLGFVSSGDGYDGKMYYRCVH